ncbi:MAG: glycosyltransferase family 9 protein [Opitutales bacterium]
MKQAWILSRPDRVGDVVVSTACIEPIKQQFPGVELSFIVSRSMRTLLEGHPHIERLILLPEPGDVDSERSFYEVCKSVGADVLVELNNYPTVSTMAKHVSFARHLHYKRHKWDFSPDAFKDRRRLGLKHEAEACFDFLEKLGCGRPLKLKPSLPAYDNAWTSLQSKHPALASHLYAVYNLTVFGNKPRWPVERFAELATKLANERGWSPVLIGVSREDPVYGQFERLYAGVCPVFDLVEQTNLAELGAVMSHAKLLVSRDTGPAHIGAAVGCPTVTLMSAHPVHCAKRWAPLGERVYVVEQPMIRRRWPESRATWWKRVFDQITVEQVMGGVLELCS